MMVLADRRQTRRRVAHLALLLVFSPLGSRHNLVCPALVCRVIEQGADVVHKQRVQHLCDLFLVGKVKSSIIGNPENF